MIRSDQPGKWRWWPRRRSADQPIAPVADNGRLPALPLTVGPVILPAPEPAPPEPVPAKPVGWVASGGLHRLGANLVTIMVGGIAGYISWLHLYALGLSQPLTPGLVERQEHLAAGLTPFSIDGMILAGTLKLRQARIENRPAHWAAYAAVILGVALTMAGNIASAPDAFWAQVLAAAPPAAFLVSVEVLAGRPLTKNLWDMIRDSWARRKAHRAARKPAGQQVAKTKAIPPAKPAEKPAAAPEPPGVPAPTPRPRKAAERPAVPAAGTAPVTGTKTRPARRVDGVVLDTDALKQHARGLVAARLAEGADRKGLGAWVARQYSPELSERWGQERVGEVPDDRSVPAPA